MIENKGKPETHTFNPVVWKTFPIYLIESQMCKILKAFQKEATIFNLFFS